MKKKLTENERKTYEFIRSGIRKGYPPSVREICDHCGFRSTSTAHRMINMLTEKGYLEKVSNLNRALRLAGGDSEKVPVLGQIDKSMPLLAAEQVERYIDFVPGADHPGELFAVTADSDIPEKALLSGDLIIAEEGAKCSEGDVCVCFGSDGRAQVKLFDGERAVGKAVAVIRML